MKVNNPQTAPDAITTAVEKASNKPFSWLDGPYNRAIGESLTLDARGSYSKNGNITSYEWDLNGDGDFEVSSTSPNPRAHLACSLFRPGRGAGNRFDRRHLHGHHQTRCQRRRRRRPR